VKKAPPTSIKELKPKGMSREVFGLLGKDGLAPAIYPSGLTMSKNEKYKSKWVHSLKGKWSGLN
jgi:hypothetical protein